MHFKDIIGQNEVKSRLIRSVKEGKVSHALLFSGKEGVGKLALAIACAQYISCTNRQESDSCGECPSCKKYDKLIHPDLHFVFPVVSTASQDKTISDNYLPQWREAILANPYLTYDQWLDVIEAENKQGLINKYESESILRKLSFKTYESEYKVMIIWLPEKMNAVAANKLLKILEEPWDKTIFLLVADDTQSMLVTILSRTQRIQVGQINQEEIIPYLIDKKHLPESDAGEIARLSEGSLAKVYELIDQTEENQFFLDLFTNWMRHCYSRKIMEVNAWLDEIAALGREKQKAFLIYGLRLIRESFLLNNQLSQLSRLAKQEADFCSKFSPFIHRNNISGIQEELNLAHFHIERNGYAKLVFLDLSLKIMQLLKS
jgi:DNA polymerase III subunit delta'